MRLGIVAVLLMQGVGLATLEWERDLLLAGLVASSSGTSLNLTNTPRAPAEHILLLINVFADTLCHLLFADEVFGGAFLRLHYTPEQQFHTVSLCTSALHEYYVNSSEGGAQMDVQQFQVWYSMTRSSSGPYVWLSSSRGEDGLFARARATFYPLFSP